MFVFVSQKIVTSNKNVLYCVPKFKWSEQTGSYWKQLSDKIMSLYTHLLERKIFWKEFAVLMKQTFWAWHNFSARIVLMKHTFCAWHTFSARIVLMKHTFCTWHTFSARIVLMKLIFCAWHTLLASRLVFVKHSVRDTAFQQVVWCSWKTFCAWHNPSISRMVFMKQTFCAWPHFQEVYGFRAKEFAALLLTFFFLIIEYEQQDQKLMPSTIYKFSIFEFLTAMNVITAVLWDVTPCTLIHRCRRFGGTTSPSSEFASLPLWTILSQIYFQCWCIFTRLHGNITSINLILSSI